jgi:hypothetical protein
MKKNQDERQKKTGRRRWSGMGEEDPGEEDAFQIG